MIRSVVSKLENLRTMKAIYQSMPSTSMAYLNNLSIGAHIKLSKSPEFTDHAIVTDINLDASTFTVIRCDCKDINLPESKAEIKEETLAFHEDQDVFLVNYKDRYMNHLMPEFKRIPQNESVKVARYFKDNHVAFEPELTKDCEHFALCCTTGYPMNFKEMNSLLIGYGALEIYGKSAFSKMTDFLKSKRRVNYNEAGQLTIMVQPNEQIILS